MAEQQKNVPTRIVGVAETINGVKWLAGCGPAQAGVCVVAEHPSPDALRQNNPDASYALRAFSRAMAKHGVPAADFYRTFACKYGKPKGKKVTASDLTVCREILREELAAVDPDIVICLGNKALTAVVGSALSITEARGAVLDMPANLPPAAAARRPEPAAETPEAAAADAAPAETKRARVFAMTNPAVLLFDPSKTEMFARECEVLARHLAGKTEAERMPEIDVVTAAAGLKARFDALLEGGEPVTAVLDLEWHGKNWLQPGAYVRTAQFGITRDYVIVAHFAHEGGLLAMDNETKAWKEIKRFLEHPLVGVVGHNAIADGQWLAAKDIDIRRKTVFDTMLAEFVINERGPFGLDEIALKYTKFGRYSDELDRWKKAHLRACEDGYGPIPDDILIPYGAIDVVVPRIAMEAQLPKLEPFMKPRGPDGEYPSLFETTMRQQEILYEIEGTGMPVDKARLMRMITAFQTRKAELLAVVKELGQNIMDAAEAKKPTRVELPGAPAEEEAVGRRRKKPKAAERHLFNPESVNDVRAVLFDHDKLNLTPVQTTDGKAWGASVGGLGFDEGDDGDDPEYTAAADKVTLEMLEDAHPFCKAMLHYRRIAQICKTWLRRDGITEEWEGVPEMGLPSHIWPDGRLHSRFSQLTETGRLRTSKPNCFLPGTLVLTSEGWRTWRDVSDAQNVRLAQWDGQLNISFDIPSKFIRTPGPSDCTAVMSSHNKHIISGSSDHRAVVMSERGWRVTRFGKLAATKHKKYAIPLQGAAVGVPERREKRFEALAAVCLVAGQSDERGNLTIRKVSRKKATVIVAAAKTAGVRFTLGGTAKNTHMVILYAGGTEFADSGWDKPLSKLHILTADAARFMANVADAVSGNRYASKRSADDVALLRTISGAACTVAPVRNKRYRGQRWILRKRKSFLPTRSVTTVPFTTAETTHCAEMPKGTLIVKDDAAGIPVFVGNCQNFPKKAEGYILQAFGGRERVSELFGEDLTDPESKDGAPVGLRTIVRPPDGWVFVEGDFVQAELFVLAALADDDVMLSALSTPGKDLHDMTAITAFKLRVQDERGTDVPEDFLVSLAKKDKKEFKAFQETLRYITAKGEVLSRSGFKNGIRVSAKNLNFGIPYGRGADAIARQVKAETGVDTPLPQLISEVEQMMRTWKNELYVKAWSYMQACADKVTNPGYLVNPFGRMRRFPYAKTAESLAAMQRQAQNTNIQSTVADAVQIASDPLIAERDRRKLRMRMCNQVHDALMLLTPEEEAETAKGLLREHMGGVRIPITEHNKVLVLGVDIDVMSPWGVKLK